jgi:3-hydroxybutyrate dehydrogenase
MLKNKVALVTGSTSGIGLGIARALAGAGADIVLNGFGEAQAVEALRAGIEADFRVRAIHVAADMARPAEIADMVARATAHFGRVDVLVNNAGIQHVSPVQSFPPERWDAIIAVNLSAVFHATRAVLPQMLERDFGRIINIASVHGLVASIDKSAYVAAKHGVVGLTKVVALETARTGVTCNAICPGWVLTPLIQAQIEARAAGGNITLDAAKVELLKEKQPSLQFVTTGQLGALAVFLCSDAASQMRGQAVGMDGGWTAQ